MAAARCAGAPSPLPGRQDCERLVLIRGRRARDGFVQTGRAILLSFALVLALLPGRAAVGQGREAAAAIDGDTIQIGSVIVQLAGIDAPELGQLCADGARLWRCGLDAAAQQRARLTLRSGALSCTPQGRGGGRSGGRGGDLAVATCQVGTEDLAQTLLMQGYAVAMPDSPPAYKEAERSARRASLGIWRGDFVHPQAWRAGGRLPGEAAQEDCPVKGMVTDGGERLYLVPADQQAHRAAVPDPGRGERRFCSDEEARAAGWRRPGETGE